MKELQLGIVSPVELADWFGIKIKSFSNARAKKLVILSNYCKFEDLGRKGVNIIEIYTPVYNISAKQLVREDFSNLWGDKKHNNNKIDTAAHAAKKAYDKRDWGVQSETLVAYFQRIKQEQYGKNSTRKIKQAPGPKGSARYIFCKRMGDGEYEPFTEEELEIKKQIYKELKLGEDVEDLEEIRALKEAKDNGEISLEDYAFYCEAATENRWNKYVSALNECFHCECTFATLLSDEVSF